MSARIKSFIDKSTSILEHSDGYILTGWRILSAVGAIEIATLIILIVIRVLVGDTDHASAKYNCEFVLKDKYLVPYVNPLLDDGTCDVSQLYTFRGLSANTAAIVAAVISIILDIWTPARKDEHGFCECTRLNFMCGFTWIIHLLGILALVCCATAFAENYRIWDGAACSPLPYASGGLDDPNPYDDGCTIAFQVYILGWAATAIYLFGLFLLLCEVCR